MEKPPSSGPAPVAGAQMLEAILNTAVGAIIVIDERGLIQNVNPATETLFGYSPSDVVGRNVSVLMPEPYRGEHDGYIRAHLRTGIKKIIGIGREATGRRRDGSLFPIHLSVSAFTVGGQRYFAGIVHDLTEREQMRGELKRQGSIFEVVFNNVPDALIICDERQTITLCNAAVEKIFDYAPSELTGRSIAAIYADDAESQRLTEAAASTSDEPSEPRQATYRRKDGATFPGEIVATAIADAHGRRIGSLSLIRDVTRQREQERALHQAQRMEAFGQLTGGIAHDFNNLLTVITGYQELLNRRLGDQKDRALLRRAQEAAEMGARVTSRLLMFARRGHFETSLVNLNEQVVSVADLLRRTLGETIDLTTLLAPRLWIVRANASEIENAIINLAVNARDSMPGGGELVIETSNIALGAADAGIPSDLQVGDYVRLSVADTGTGMTPEVRQRALEPFFTTKQPGKGTGLGLSGIYGFVRQLGGTVAIDSEVGHGTTVSVYLPRAEAKEAVQADEDRGDSLPYSAGETVLLVEDHADVRRITRDRLDELGYRVVEADSGPRAIETLESAQPIDLVLSDVVMAGGMSGFDVARWVHDNRPAIGVVLVSGYPDEVLRSAASPGADLRILRKPYSMLELARALRRELDG
ncbi:MAG: PAS domain S-box protein [Alphaproteobacteria bacterium]